MVFPVCPSGSALEFDGVDDYLEVSDSEELRFNGTEPFSVSVWFKRLGYISGNESIIAKGYNGDPENANYILGTWNNEIGWFWEHGSGSNVLLSSGVTPEIGKWCHIVGVWDGLKQIVYVNGQMKNSVIPSGVPESGDNRPLIIGRVTGGTSISTSYVNGAIDEAAIYNSALSAEEIQMSMHRKLVGDEPNLVGYWDFDEGEGQVAYDLSGNGNHGRLGSGPYGDDSDPMWVASDAPVGVCPVICAVDIKPGSCPNPVNVKSHGVVPVAVLGSEDFDVSLVDGVSIQLVGVSAIRSGYEDVGAPVADGNECGWSEAGPDGFVDLTVKFETQEIVQALGDVNDGDVLPLMLTGVLEDGTPIEGTDCIVIRGKFKPFNKGDINRDRLVNVIDFAIMAESWLECTSY
jgi:hypothetical protein